MLVTTTNIECVSLEASLFTFLHSNSSRKLTVACTCWLTLAAVAIVAAAVSSTHFVEKLLLYTHTK